MRSTALIRSLIYSFIFSLLTRFTATVNDVISFNSTVSLELSKNRVVKIRKPVIIQKRQNTANVGLIERINPESTSHMSDPIP